MSIWSVAWLGSGTGLMWSGRWSPFLNIMAGLAPSRWGAAGFGRLLPLLSDVPVITVIMFTHSWGWLAEKSSLPVEKGPASLTGLKKFLFWDSQRWFCLEWQYFLLFLKHLFAQKGQSRFISFWYQNWTWISTFQWDEEWKFLQDYQLGWVCFNSSCRGWNQAFLVLCSSGGAELLSLAHGVI